MKKLILSSLLLLFTILSLQAQDVITKKNGEDLSVKIIKVNPDLIEYTKLTMPDGPIFTISKADILMIIYQDGSRDTFSDYKANDYTSTLSSDQLAKIATGMKYKELKTIYNHRDYGSFRGIEKYNPALMGVCSFLIPGLGQMISGEGGRGAGFLCGGIACSAALGVASYYIYAPGLSQEAIMCASISTIILSAGLLAIDICAIVDAVRVAEVKNMYYEDLQHTALDIKLLPKVDVLMAANQMIPTAGLSLQVNF